MKKYGIYLLILLLGCKPGIKQTENHKIRIIIDSDANNELDDQHALAYAFLNSDIFNVAGITVNNTRNGDGIQGQYEEALRIIKLFNLQGKMPLLKGAVKNYSDILPYIHDSVFDGKPAVDFIINEAHKTDSIKLVLIPVGKLTNIALALAKEPAIAKKIRIVWLGSNYPNPGEYNLDNDTSAVNPVIQSGAVFEMVTVRYGEPSGTGAVTVTRDEILAAMKNKGPISNQGITGRHGNRFNQFGNYSVDLFEHAEMHGATNSRALFDLAAVAIVKNPQWAIKREIPSPRLQGINWIENPDNPEKIFIWENFNRDSIVKDLFQLMDKNTAR